ncbi:MAG: response regulator receiver protein [Myxococcaceae bacterium]|nr:response regulator receiver protein [Myxococcaceae bacterium]
MTKLILVVEDTPEIREAVAEILAQEGHSTIEAADGREALAALRGGAKADLILLDLMMPGMGGLEFREQQLRDPLLADIPVILMTAVRKIDAEALRLSHLLLKPFGPAQLLDAVNAAQK